MKQKLNKIILSGMILTLSTTISGAVKLGSLATGQTTSYYYYADDGYYQKGIKREYTRDDDKNIVTDLVTGLMWQDDSDVGSIKKEWGEAKTYCNDLTLGGYNDWYLPSIEELVSITDKGRYNPSINPIFQNIYTNYGYCSATTDIVYTGNAWYLYFYNGEDNFESKMDECFIRCVRIGGQ